MGFKCSLYCVPKTVIEKYKNITQEEIQNDDVFDRMFDELKSNRIRYDTLTDVILSNTDENFYSRLFTHELDIEDDIIVGTISKVQFLNIIEDVRVNHIVKWFDGRRVDGPDTEHLGSWWKEHICYAKSKPRYFETDENDLSITWSSNDALLANQLEWNIKADNWKTVYSDKELIDKGKQFFNIDLNMDDKWSISNGFTYEYLIFELIHILKIFDWENDVMVVIGG